MKINSFNVTPILPDNLKALTELSQNMWFTWNWEAIMMFVGVNDELWHRSHRNPKWILGNVNPQRLQELSQDAKFLETLDKVHRTFREYMSSPKWFDNNRKPEESDMLAAYFSMEFGIGEGLPMYSGGLGMLSGDHLKSSSDLGLPLVGVGLFYQRGYIQQVLNRDGWQVERYPENDWANMPVEKVRDAKGAPLQVTVPLANETISVGIWRVPVGRVSLYLLDTNLPENPPQHRLITEQLYGGDRENRIKQEIVLGLGGVRALELMGIHPTVYHINEGHSAFLLFERIRQTMRQKGLDFNEAREAVWSSSVFTTHTPVIAGNEHFEPELVRRFLEPYSRELGLTWDEFLSLGKEDAKSTTFCMTVVALKLAAFLNGVSKLHGEVSREMWRGVWPALPTSEIPVHSITNGVHTSSWISHEHLNLYVKHLAQNPDCAANPSDACDWGRIRQIPDAEFWDVHMLRKQKLIGLIRGRYKRQLARQGADVTVLDEADRILDPKLLTIGFARRFATYKRATLLFRDLDRLAAIINNPAMPVQLVFAGKAHQADVHGKEFVKYIARLMSDPRFKGKLIFVEDYNMNVARYMVQGVDVWLNNPTRPMEASGTSGMKASINGVLNLSVLDGWWCEAYRPEIGWAIGGSEHYNDETERDNVESEAICNLISKEIAPLYYDRGELGLPKKWIERCKISVQSITPYFSTHRMVREYYDRFYVSAHRHGKLMLSDGIARATAQWRKCVRDNWSKVYIKNATPRLDHEIRMGERVTLRAKVWLGGLSPDDVTVEVCLGKLDPKGELSGVQTVAMRRDGTEGDAHVYTAEAAPGKSGRQDFAMRVMAGNKNIPHPYMPLFIRWEE
ncbi:MAG: alpha-glucan family phosphorylase [Elusimicrobiales bacterium]|nr:alpha-glucan family phosphorylase [Elusimicrobiales bacterium]